jgi:hypothetical protein
VIVLGRGEQRGQRKGADREGQAQVILRCLAENQRESHRVGDMEAVTIRKGGGRGRGHRGDQRLDHLDDLVYLDTL